MVLLGTILGSAWFKLGEKDCLEAGLDQSGHATSFPLTPVQVGPPAATQPHIILLFIQIQCLMAESGTSSRVR
jgi:hypothetical protein